MNRDELNEKAARIATLIDWQPTCLPGQERPTIVRQVLEALQHDHPTGPKHVGLQKRLADVTAVLNREWPDDQDHHDFVSQQVEDARVALRSDPLAEEVRRG